MDLPSTFHKKLHDEKKFLSIGDHFNSLGNTNMKVFKIGLGTSGFSSNVDFDANGEPYGEEYELRAATVRKAIAEGVNYIDTAPLYGGGKCEKVLGKAIRGLPRESFFLATKIGRNHECQFDSSPQGVCETFAKSLQNLEVEYVDVLQIHDIEFADDLEPIAKDIIAIIERFRREGKVRYIGISGYPLTPLVKMADMAKGKLDTVLSYCRMTLFNQDLLDCSELMNNNSIGLINAAFLGMGLLTPSVLNDPPLPFWHPAPKELVIACQQAAQLCKEKGLDLPKLATDYVFQKCSRVALQLVGMNSPTEVENNIAILRDGLTSEERKIQEEIVELFRKCPKTHWENVEIEKYRKDRKKFQDTLYHGPRIATQAS